MTAVGVVIVDDSALCRSRMREIIEAEGDARVVGEVASGDAVVPLIERVRPAVLVTDLVMPGVDGLGVVKATMRACPVPIIVVSAGGFEETKAFEATRLGALEVVRKPAFGDRAAEAAFRDAVRRVATVPVVRHPGRSLVPPSPAGGGATALSWRGLAPDVLGIGASAGGPPAVLELLEALPAAGAPALLVAQHMPADHAEAFAQFLDARCRFDVVVCRGVAPLLPGVVVVPGDGCDLVVTGRDRAASVPAQGTVAPSVDRLLTSLANELGPRAAGAVLTGIGRDGSTGLAALRAAGGLTFAQDQASSAVFGMPQAAAPAACFTLRPRHMAEMVARAVQRPIPMRSRR